MAEINVERKDRSIWPWILGLLLLLLAIWGLVELLGDDDDVVEQPVAGMTAEPVVPAVVEEPVVAEAPPPGAAPAALPAPVSQYMTQCTPPLPEGAEMGMQHQFTIQCVQNLADALGAVIQRDQVQGTEVSQRLDALRQRAQALQASNAQATTHANITREAFIATADLVESVYRAGYSTVARMGDEVIQLRNAAQSVQGTVPMLNQRDAVHTFFREAGDAIRLMAETPAVRT